MYCRCGFFLLMAKKEICSSSKHSQTNSFSCFSFQYDIDHFHINNGGLVEIIAKHRYIGQFFYLFFFVAMELPRHVFFPKLGYFEVPITYTRDKCLSHVALTSCRVQVIARAIKSANETIGFIPLYLK